MSLISELSSQIGDRSAAANRSVASRCLANPDLLGEIAGGLQSPSPAVVGDCAEVMTMVATDAPELIVPYAAKLAALLGHKTTKVRWEAMHALALIADRCPEVMAPLLPGLAEMLTTDKSTIVRDYATDALGAYAKSSRTAAKDAYPLLRSALLVWEGKHAGRALAGLANVVQNAPDLAEEIRDIGEAYLGHERGMVRKAAKALVKAACRT